MVRKSFWIVPIIFLFAAMGATAAHADTITTYSVSATFSDGATASGTFSYDSDDSTYTAVDIASVDAANAAASDQFTSTANIVAANSSILEIYSDNGTAGLSLVFPSIATPLTGPENLISGPCWEGGCLYVSPNPLETTAGYITPVATPEPTTGALLLTGVGLVGTLALIRKREAQTLEQAN